MPQGRQTLRQYRADKWAHYRPAISGRRATTAAAAGFDILTLSPFVWFKSDGVLWQDSGRTTPVTANNDPVGAWDDASGNGRHATQASTRPTYKTAQIGSAAALDFVPGSSTFLTTAAFSVSQPTTWFVVADDDNTGTEQFFDCVTNRNALFTSGGVWDFYAGNIVTGPAADTSPHIFAVTFNGASSKLRVGGGAGTTGDAGALGVSGGVRIGVESGGGTNFFDGRIAEVIGFPSELSTTNLDNVGVVLATKYGLTWSAAS